ncbi:UNVERIFIED_CONTAM: hypothetical protein FKN15_042085 [Acipenser sinensis]
MSEANITFHTTKQICSNGGSLQYKQLQNIFRRFNIPDTFFCEILKNGSRFVIVQGSEDKLPGCGVSPDSTVIAKTSVRLCKDYPKDCGDCEGLHLCRDFVQGICKQRELSFGVLCWGRVCKLNAKVSQFDTEEFALGENFSSYYKVEKRYGTIAATDNFCLH